MFRKFIFLLFVFLSACSYNSGRIRLLNYDLRTELFGDIPSSIIVSKGDTLYSISRRYNVPLRDLITVNQLTPPYTLAVGQSLSIPTAKYHIVAKGDTLYNISKRYNIDLTTLSRLNNLSPPYTLSIGQKLALPATISSSRNMYADTDDEVWLPQKSTKVTSSKKSTVKKAQTKAKKTVSSSKTTTVKKRTTKFFEPVHSLRLSMFKMPLILFSSCCAILFFSNLVSCFYPKNNVVTHDSVLKTL